MFLFVLTGAQGRCEYTSECETHTVLQDGCYGFNQHLILKLGCGFVTRGTESYPVILMVHLVFNVHVVPVEFIH